MVKSSVTTTAALALTQDHDDEYYCQEIGGNSLVWKSTHNPAAPLCQIPPELLPHMFQPVCRDWNHESPTQNIRGVLTKMPSQVERPKIVDLENVDDPETQFLN
jgi:hypothetical protein